MKNIFSQIIMLIMISINFSSFASVPIVDGSYIVTFKNDAGLVQPPVETNRGKGQIPFGTHSTGQSKSAIATALGTNGEVASIFETINAVHMRMDAKEADRLSRDKRVLSIEQDRVATTQSTQTAPGWGLDRLDQLTPTTDNTYNYSNTGAGQTIYILDSGLTLSNSAVAAEFGGRASVFYDVKVVPVTIVGGMVPRSPVPQPGTQWASQKVPL
ncbi:MAG: protease inhibitor I9 family protein [Sulfuricella sp.]|nr:protease inhibitor I9 family protein [Sulfuricella sp.]